MKHFHLLLWIPLLYTVVFAVFWIQIYVKEVIEFEDLVLEKQVNYATDSAIDELLESGKLSQDYNNEKFVTVEPELAKQDLEHTLSLNFDGIPTEGMKEYIDQHYIKCFVICTYDGIYEYHMQQNETNNYALVQSPKIPYFYTDKDTGQQFCLTLDPKWGYWDFGTSEESYGLHKFDEYTSAPSTTVQRQSINDQVAKIINWSLYENYKWGTNDTSITLPAIADTVRGEQPVIAPTVIAVVEGQDRIFNSTIIAESIGGSQFENADQIVGYTLTAGATVNNVSYVGRYYAKASWWKNHTELKDYCENGHYFDDAFDAAKSGYNYIGLCK